MGSRRIIEQFFLVAGLQVFVSYFLKARGVGPVFLLVWILYIGWYNGDIISLIAAFGGGLLYDLMVKGTPGWSSFLFLLIAYLNNFFPSLTYLERIAGAAVFSAFYFLCLSFDPTQGFLWQWREMLVFTLRFVLYTVGLVSCLEWYLRIILWRRKSFSGFY